MNNANINYYTDINNYLLNDNYVFNFFIGGRGIGKTYSMLKKIYEEEIPFIYLRYTNTELDISVNADLFHQYGDKITFNRIEDGFYSFKTEDKIMGYGMSLTTFKSKRGIDFSWIKLIFFDEFIPEVGARKVISYVGDVFQNMYETVNRNRELEGDKPVLFVGCANSNNINNPLMIDLGLVKIAERLIRSEQEFYFDDDRRMQLAILKASPVFLEQKSKTALYSFATEKFKDMSLNNIFAYNDFSNVKQKDLRGYQPIVAIANRFTIYKQKGDEQYYCHPSIGAGVDIYDINNVIEKQRLLNKYLIFFNAKFYKNKMTFATYEIKSLFIELFLKL